MKLNIITLLVIGLLSIGNTNISMEIGAVCNDDGYATGA